MAYGDVFSMLDDRAQAHLGRAYGPARSNADVSAEVLRVLREEFAPGGVDVTSVDIAQRGMAFPLKYLGDYATHAKSEL